ncbi:MAG: hypothetical protein ABIJ61_11935 [bacterium]
MLILGFYWPYVLLGIGLVGLYSYARRIGNELLANASTLGAGIVILLVFWQNCPVNAINFVLIMLGAALIFYLAFWLIFKARSQGG